MDPKFTPPSSEPHKNALDVKMDRKRPFWKKLATNPLNAEMLKRMAVNKDRF
jgi:hypothetical protein